MQRAVACAAHHAPQIDAARNAVQLLPGRPTGRTHTSLRTASATRGALDLVREVIIKHGEVAGGGVIGGVLLLASRSWVVWSCTHIPGVASRTW